MSEQEKKEYIFATEYSTTSDAKLLFSHYFPRNGDVLLVLSNGKVIYIKNSEEERGKCATYKNLPIELNMEKLARGSETIPEPL